MKVLILFFCILTSLDVFADTYLRCVDDSERLKARSIELQKIVNEDQADRNPPPNSPEGWSKLQRRDDEIPANAKSLSKSLSQQF